MKLETVMKFGSPIWRAYTPLPRGAFEWAMDYKEDNNNKQRSNRGGYQSVAQSFDYLPFPFINNIRESFPFMKNIRMANWWLNVNEKGDFNFRHTHPKCDLSGIWYITDNDGELYFQDPLIQTRSKLYEHILGVKNAGIQMDCKAGSLLIFPADVPHRVEEHVLDTKRISVSFNINSKPQGGNSY